MIRCGVPFNVTVRPNWSVTCMLPLLGVLSPVEQATADRAMPITMIIANASFPIERKSIPPKFLPNKKTPYQTERGLLAIKIPTPPRGGM
jgi:hypothetical protein